MLSTSKMDAKSENQTKSVAKPTLEKNDNLDKIKRELEEKVQSIQQAFQQAWEKSPTESKYSHMCYFISDDGAVESKDTQIQSLLEKFKNYKNVQQIKADFWTLKAYFINQSKGIVSQSFGDNYLVNLLFTEALFIRAFMDNLSYVMQSTPISDPVLSVETESKVDFDSIAEQVKKSYEEELHDRLFAGKSKELIDELLPAVTDLTSRIELYHESRTKVFDVKPLSAKDDSPDDPVPKPIKQLLSDELAYDSLCISDDILKLKLTRQELIEARQTLLVNHNQQIDAFLTKIRAKVVPVQINYDAISELAPLATELHQAEAAISSINEQNRLRLLESDGVLRLKEILRANKELKCDSLEKFVENKRPRFFGSTLWKEYEDLLTDLANSPHVQKIDNFTLPTPMAVTKWTEKRDRIVEKLEAMKSHVIERVNNKISSSDFIRKKEEIIRTEGDGLRKKTCSETEILSVDSDVLLQQRRAALDKQWDGLLASQDNIEILKSIPGKLYRVSETLDPCVKKDVYIQTALTFQKKLAPYLKKVNVSPKLRDAEKKAQPQNQAYKSVSSDESAHAQGFQFVDQETKLNPASVPVYGSVQFKDEVRPSLKPKRHWYSRFVDKPWKCALLIGLGVFVGAALTLSGVGLWLEFSLIILLAGALGGGAAAGLLTGGITYACTSHEYEPPRQITQVRPDSAMQRNDLMDRRRNIMSTVSAPSVFPVHAPNVLSDPESTSCFDWFLHRRKEHRVDPPVYEGVVNYKKGK